MNEQDIQDYSQFLMEVLQATIESKGNREVVYPLLADNQEKLDENFIAVLQAWAEATEEVLAAEAIAGAIGNFGYLI